MALERTALQTKAAIERRPAAAVTTQRRAVAAAPSPARVLQQRLGNRATQRFAAQLKRGAECSSCATGRPCDVCGAPMRKSIRDRAPVQSQMSVTGSGMPLPVSLAADFGARLGNPVDDVVIHADVAAAAAARSLHAQAFTIENHIYFGAGRWAPHTTQGRELLAHELVHVLHQRGAPAAARSTAELEGEADRIGITVARGGRVAASEVSVGAAPSHAPQARKSDEIDLDRAAIQTRLDEITADNIGVLSKYASYITAGTEPPAVVREAVDAIEREKLILGFVDSMLIDEGTTGIQHVTDILDVIQQAELESKTEESTIHYLMELTGSRGAVRVDVEQLILRNALRFPKVTMVLYDSILESYAKEYAKGKQKFDDALAALLARDKKELARLFIGMYTRADLSSTAAAYEQQVRLQKQSNPGSIQIKWGGAGEVTAPEDLEFVVLHKWDMKAPSFPAPYGFLQDILYNWYLYRLYDHLYGEVASRKDLFRVRATTVIGNMGVAVPSVLNLEDMLKEAFGTETLVSARGGIGRERVPGSGIYHFFKSYGGDGFQHVQQSLLGVLNPWVLGMGEWDRLMLAFELYDFVNKLGHQLSSLISIRTLITIVGFAVFIIGIQFVPFVNLIVDAIIAFFFVQSVLAVIRMLGRLMMADYWCSNTKSFIDVHRATQELVGMDEDAAGALVDICTWGAGKLAKYATYARKKPPSKIDDIVKEDPIAHGPAKVRDAGKNATERKGTHEKWEEKLSSETRAALEADPNAAKVFREMDPDVRRAFTLCSTDCLPIKPVPTQDQVKKVADLLKRTGTKSDDRALREHLKINRNNLDNALKETDKVTTKAGLDEFLDGKVIGRAKDKGWIATREGPHQGWSLRRKAGDAPVSEYDIKPHGTQPGTDSFFQSHHGVQGEWAKDLKIPNYDYSKQPGILLRDSRKGTPHQIVTERQAGRAAGRSTRKYSDKATGNGERDLLIEDMKQAGVPDKIANDLLKQTDDYFAGLYNAAKTKGMKDADLKNLFGDWKP